MSWASSGKSQRLSLGGVVTSGTAYDSLLLQVNDLGAMTAPRGRATLPARLHPP
ncbi:MAG: hypothetical protein ABIP55_05740 [Tepidisphaeraceae bacterium]